MANELRAPSGSPGHVENTIALRGVYRATINSIALRRTDRHGKGRNGNLGSRLGLMAVTMAIVAIGSVAQAGLIGIDVSTHQGFVNWTSVKQSGVSYAFAKATEGVNFVDNRFHSNMTNARLAGVPIGPYHFARPDSSIGTLADPVKQDAINEANDFVDQIESYYTNHPGSYLRPVLDVERLPQNGEINTTSEIRAYLSDWVNDFNSVVQDRLGVDVIIYTGSSYANNYLNSSIANYDLWFARWTYNINNQPTASNLGIWDDWEFWQWSDSESYGGESPVDANYFDGTLADLDAFLVQEPGLEGDYNGNGVVDAADYTLWRDTWLSLGDDLPADGDGDGFVGNSDYDLWVANYGATSSSTSSSTAVPEPATGLLLVGAFAAFSCRRMQGTHA